MSGVRLEAGRDRPSLAVPRTGSIGPKSAFQIGGAGAVGTGSVRGMPLLQRLCAVGATIWPFTQAGWPTVVEIYPRLLTGPLRKSAAAARAALLRERYPHLHPAHLDLATDSEDAFDAAVSALVMVEHLADLATLPSSQIPSYASKAASSIRRGARISRRSSGRGHRRQAHCGRTA